VEHASGTYVTEDFRHHHPNFSGEIDVLAAAMKQNTEEHPKKVLEIQRALEDGDLVAVHSRVRLDPDGQDIAAPVPEDPPNQNGAFSRRLAP
jgi:predicted SnoaL-like aldol condensation-catalyzing enzyme